MQMIVHSFSDSKLFQERRRDSKDLLEIVNNEGAYERKYKLLEGAFNKLLDVSIFRQNNGHHGFQRT